MSRRLETSLILGLALLIVISCNYQIPSGASGDTGVISGSLSYPAGAIPPMTIYARLVQIDSDVQTTYSIHVDMNTREYEIEVPPGEYVVFAWTDAGAFTENRLGGHYSCGCVLEMHNQNQTAEASNTSCINLEDRIPLTVTVRPGERVTDVFICQWLHEAVPVP